MDEEPYSPVEVSSQGPEISVSEFQGEDGVVPVQAYSPYIVNEKDEHMEPTDDTSDVQTISLTDMVNDDLQDTNTIEGEMPFEAPGSINVIAGSQAHGSKTHGDSRMRQMESFPLASMVNSQCFNAAVEEHPSFKYVSSISKFASTLRHLQARRQSQYGCENKNSKPSTQLGFLNKPSHSEGTNFRLNQSDPVSYKSFCSQTVQTNIQSPISQPCNSTSQQSASANINETFSLCAPSSLETLPQRDDNMLSPGQSQGHNHIEKSPGSLRVQSPGSSYSPAISPISACSSSELSYPTHVSQQHPLKLKSLEFKGHPNKKKYRYNQTALALQQSGLMHVTVKTAELMRKSRLLQMELLKLRTETASFVHSVLSNPENKHLRENILAARSKNQDPVVTSSTT